jgi:hypothetical protein
VKMLNQLLSSPPALLTFAGAIIAAAGIFWAALNNAASQKEILRLNRQVTEKSDQIAKLNEQIVDLVTGGDSFIYLDCIPRQNLPFLVLIHKRGEFPALRRQRKNCRFEFETVGPWDAVGLRKLPERHCRLYG